MAHSDTIERNIKGWHISAAGHGWHAKKGDRVESAIFNVEACALTNLQRACITLGLDYDSAINKKA